MPTIAENMSWGTYSWSKAGDEWSQDWGDATTQWHATILPRIRRFFPAKNVLEIAPGFGRWSAFLLQDADHYIGVDLNPECTEACKKRFANAPHATFVSNDGKSLDSVEDGSIDFAFSFDSLVHVEIDILSAYMKELSQKLAPNGIAFLHHSNLGEYDGLSLKLCKQLYSVPQPGPAAKILRRLQLSDWDRWRAPSVTAERAAAAATANGLKCVSQEIVNWGHRNMRLIDCFTTLTLPKSKWARENIVVRNPQFIKEARSAKAISRLYQSL